MMIVVVPILIAVGVVVSGYFMSKPEGIDELISFCLGIFLLLLVVALTIGFIIGLANNSL